MVMYVPYRILNYYHRVNYYNSGTAGTEVHVYRRKSWIAHYCIKSIYLMSLSALTCTLSVSAKAPHQRVTWSRQADAAATGPGRCCSTTTLPTASQNILQPRSKRCVAHWWLRQVATERHSHQRVWYV